MLDQSQFKRSRKGLDGPLLDEWFCALPELDIEVIVKGNATEPNADALVRASQSLEILDVLKERAVDLLGEFIKDEGTWSLSHLEFGEEAERQRCDFLLSYKFEAQGDPWRDTYVYFYVGFVILERGNAVYPGGRPVKLVVGFH